MNISISSKMRSAYRHGRSFLPLCLAAFLLLSCGNSENKLGKEKIMVSIEPLRYFTEQIAGNRFEVSSIVPSDYSPESYKPTPQQLMELGDSKLYFKVGNLGFETTWLEQAVKDHANLKVVDTSDSMRIGSHGMQLSTFDPHTWTSAQNAKMICRTICVALCRQDSAGAAVYRQNLAKTIRRITEVENRIHKLLTNVPSRTFITVHPSLSYFADEYGLRQLCIEKEGKESAPADLEQLVRQAKDEHVGVILLQKQFSVSQAKTIAHETGARPVYINPLGYDWPKEMLAIAKVIKNGQ